MPLPAINLQAPGPFRYADVGCVARDFAEAGLSVDHIEELYVTVFEASSDGEMVDWVRAVGLTRLLDELPEVDQRAWELDLANELRRTANGGPLQLGGVTRLVRACRA